MWSSDNLEHTPLMGPAEREVVRSILKLHKADALLTGTSVNEIEWEKIFVAVATELEIPSLALLDFWTNYAHRFADADGRLVYVPDFIAVMDDHARESLERLGIDGNRIVVTGQPLFDDLQAPINHGARADDPLVLFLSQPFAQIYGSDEAARAYLGYDEREVLASTALALQSIAARRDLKITLSVKAHPREVLDHLPTGDDRVKIIREESEDIHATLATADLVVGMQTMLLVEACLMGCRTVSVQPGLKIEDPLPLTRWGMSSSVYDRAQIQAVLDQALSSGPDTMPRSYPMPTGATACIAELACELAERATKEKEKTHG